VGGFWQSSFDEKLAAVVGKSLKIQQATVREMVNAEPRVSEAVVVARLVQRLLKHASHLNLERRESEIRQILELAANGNSINAKSNNTMYEHAERTTETMEVSSDPCRINRDRAQRRGPGRKINLYQESENSQEATFTNGWLSASILHDLRNPVAAIYAAAQMLMSLDSGPTPAKRLATNIYRAAARMRELLAELNSVGPGDRSTPELCEIREVIAAASTAASAATENHRVRIRLEVPERMKLSLVRSSMERVFFNLIANALEAMPTGGKLRIVGRKSCDCVLIELEDTGPGIPCGIRDRLFEPFVTRGKQNGLGLGLALSRQTILGHGGEIWTEPASGARFVIRLPVSRARSSIDKLDKTDETKATLRLNASGLLVPAIEGTPSVI
jgi:signal transduction histidine kinase